MHCIQNSCIGTPNSFNKAIASFTCVLAITVIALSIIGLIASSSGPFNAVVQFSATTNGVLLGTSIFVFILDLVWIAVLYKKQKSHLSPTQHLLRSEEINETDSFSQLADEIILRVFSFLSPVELTKCSEISRKWGRLAADPILWDAFDLEKIFPLLNVFDKSDWITHFNLSFVEENVSPLNKRHVIPVLKRCLSSLSIEGNAGVTLLKMPAGLTFNKLKIGNTALFRFVDTGIPTEIRNIPVNTTYWIVITNNILKGSQCKSISVQETLVNQTGCRRPTLLEITALLVAIFKKSRQRRLYSDIYTRCHFSAKPFVIGDFSPEGIDFSNENPDAALDSYGIGGVFPLIDPKFYELKTHIQSGYSPGSEGFPQLDLSQEQRVIFL